MKILCFGDAQASDGSEMSYLDPSRPLQHVRVEKLYRDLAAFYAKHKCQGIVDLGDSTDDKSSIPVPVIELLGEGMELLPHSSFNYKLTGNHEFYLRNNKISNRKLFSHKFTVVDQHEVYDFGSCLAVFCAYPADHDALAEWLISTAADYADRPKVLFGHFSVAGCALSNGTQLKGIPREVLDPYDLCLLGHIHMPQSLGDRIHYVGSPFQQDWGESGEEKRVAVLDTDNLAVEWVKMTGYPRYRTVELKDFNRLANGKTEDRYKVILRNHTDANDFFQHALFHKAHPVYDYDEAEAGAAPDATAEPSTWSVDSLLQKWLKVKPPKDYGLEVSDEDMLAVGIDVAASQK